MCVLPSQCMHMDIYEWYNACVRHSCVLLHEYMHALPILNI
jgi:hypothetical protein